MKTEIERLEEKNTVLLRVEVPADTFGKAIDEAYKKISNQLVIPGFRKGKVPKPVIDSRVGKQSVQEEALQSALPSYYIDALKDVDIEPIDQPEVDIVQIEESKPLIFTAKVKVKPEVKLGDYKGTEIEKPSAEVTEEEIDEQIETLRDNFANLEPVEDRSVKEGDFVLIDFEGFIDDEPFEGGSAEDYLLEVGSKTFIPGFEEQLIGMSKGESKEIEVAFPDDYGSEQLAGKEARFKVSLKEIKEKKLQELDDDFAKQVGFDTVDELRSDIREKVREAKRKYANTEVRRIIVDKVTDAAEVEVHDVMVERELDEMLKDFSSDVKRQGLELNQYLEMTGTTVEDLHNEWRDRAEDRVKSRLVLEAISEAENVEVSPEDVDNEIKKAAEATGRDFDEVKQIFQMKGTINSLGKRLLIGKAIDWLIENANIKIKEEMEEKENQEGKGME
ncbi:MAG: trigger factor [Actinobacteria bacterium]|nr:trigger factor [Actinomycetota bacterium]